MHLSKVVLFMMVSYGCGSIIISAMVPKFAAINHGNHNMASKTFSQPSVFDRFPRNSSNSPSRRRRQNEAPKSYKINYFIVDNEGNKHYRDEEADESGAVSGSYGYIDATGLLRIVTYTADSNGFRADIKSNEQGLDGKRGAADVKLNEDPSDSDGEEKDENISGERRGVPRVKPYRQDNEAAAVNKLYEPKSASKNREEDDDFEK